MPSPSTPADGRRDFLEQLAAIREDPKVKRLARVRAGDPELAEDALQESYFAVARTKHPERIEDLRAYYCRALLRSIHRLRGQLGGALVVDFGGVADNWGHKLGGEPPPPSFDEFAGSKLLIQGWLRYLAAHRAVLSRTVPGRSTDPARYRDMIVSVAERVLLASISGSIRDADVNLSLQSAYPQRFAGDGVATDNIHQRFARARGDVYRLLRAIISRGDLYA